MELRVISLTDLFRFGKDILGLDMHDEPHGRWCRELFVQKKYLLPEVYDWEDVKVALAAQSDIHQRMLISSRSSYKSSVNIVDLAQWVLVLRDMRGTLNHSATFPWAGSCRRSIANAGSLTRPRVRSRLPSGSRLTVNSRNPPLIPTARKDPLLKAKPKFKKSPTKTTQELMRHANAGITMNLYAQALTPTKRAAHLKVVEMIRPAAETASAPLCSQAEESESVSA